MDESISRNALQSIRYFEVPLESIKRKTLKEFLKAYNRCYPFKIDEYKALSQLTDQDWQFFARQYLPTVHHHYGCDYQYLGFYDLWALAEDILNKARTPRGSYNIQSLTDKNKSTQKEFNEAKNNEKYYQFTTVVISMFPHKDDEGKFIIKAPALVCKDKIYFYDYVSYRDQNDLELHHCEEINCLKRGKTAFHDVFCYVRYTGTYEIDKLDTVSHWDIYPKDVPGRLLEFANSKGLINYKGNRAEIDTRIKLEHKGPPDNFEDKYLKPCGKRYSVKNYSRQ